MIRRFLLATPFLLCAGSMVAAAETWENLTTDQGLSGNEIQFIKEDEDGGLWIGTRSGLSFFSNGKLSTRLDGIEIWDILKASPGCYWIGTSGGVVHLQGDRQETFLQGTTVAPVVPLDGAAVWAISKNRATEKNSLVEWKGGGWEAIEKFKDEKVVDLKRTSDGTLWVLVDGNGVMAANPRKSLDQATHHLEGSNVTTVMEDSRKHVWFGLWEGGVVVYDGKNWTRHLPKEKSFIFHVVEDARGTVWVATNQNGLWRQEGDKWVNDLKEEGGVNLLAATSDGRVWISTQTTGGLRYWDGRAWQVSLESPLPIRCLTEDRAHGLWAGGVLDGVHARK
ncbi:MAG: hypothetical protein HYU36_21140 [Planctomycetes bacterium]|nr:hypothetical protein [Planctomycetota bacterium]